MTDDKDDESFADAPETIADLKSEKTDLASDWTPRDMLIKLLRAVDRGELKAEAMVVAWYVPGKDQAGVVPTFMCAGGRGALDLIGLSAYCTQRLILQGGEP